jgi:hypothetical protein
MKMAMTTEKFFKLTFFMKSGNSFSINGVTDYKYEKTYEGTTTLSITQVERSPLCNLILPSIDLKQIEAVIAERYLLNFDLEKEF